LTFYLAHCHSRNLGQRYVVRLTDEERKTLQEIAGKFKGSSQKVRRAQVLLKADDLLRSETSAWQAASNARQRGIDWHFKVDDARRKLKSIYPKIIV
jgi:hypothetical protein